MNFIKSFFHIHFHELKYKLHLNLKIQMFNRILSIYRKYVSNEWTDGWMDGQKIKLFGKLRSLTPIINI